MATPTSQRVRISLEMKGKLIEDSKKPGFDRKKLIEKYGIGRSAISNILKDQVEILKSLDSISVNKNVKSVKKSPLEVLENKLYEFLCEKTRMGLPINGPLLIGQAQNIHAKMTRNNPDPPKFEFLHFRK